MPAVEPSSVTPAARATSEPTTVATRSANPITINGMSHSTGERQVTISSSATTNAVTANKVMLAPVNASAM
nr:hypothetical protein CPGR_00947 [Mycolicibacter nonchromogenicus]